MVFIFFLMDSEADFIDIYELLAVASDATVKEIGKAYRIKSRTCHPDKVGPDNEAAGGSQVVFVWETIHTKNLLEI